MSTFDIQTIAIDDIDADENFNARKRIHGLPELAESLAAVGVQTPLVVHQKRSGKIALVSGFRRLGAAKLAGLTEVPCKVLPAKTKKIELFLLNLLENASREDMNPMEEAEAIGRLIEEGMGKEDIAAQLGWTQTLVTQRERLLGYTDELQNALREDKVSVRQAQIVAQLPEDRQERYIEVAAGLTVNKLREMVDNELSPEEPGEPEAPEPAEPEAPGAGETESPEGGEAVDLTEIESSVISGLIDLIVHATTVDKQRAEQIVNVQSIKFTDLSAEDLTSLSEVVDMLTSEIGCAGASDEIDAESVVVDSLNEDEADPFAEVE